MKKPVVNDDRPEIGYRGFKFVSHADTCILSGYNAQSAVNVGATELLLSPDFAFFVCDYLSFKFRFFVPETNVNGVYLYWGVEGSIPVYSTTTSGDHQATKRVLDKCEKVYTATRSVSR